MVARVERVLLEQLCRAMVGPQASGPGQWFSRPLILAIAPEKQMHVLIESFI